MSNIETNVELFAVLKRDAVRDTVEGVYTQPPSNNTLITDQMRWAAVAVLRHPAFWGNFVAAHVDHFAGLEG